MKYYAKPSAVFNAINGTKLIEGDDITKDVAHLSGAVQEKKSFDIKKIEKCCHKSAWLVILEILEKKNANGVAIHARKQKVKRIKYCI